MSPQPADTLKETRSWTDYDGARIAVIAWQDDTCTRNLMASIRFTLGETKDDAATVRVGSFLLHVGYYEPSQVETILGRLSVTEPVLCLPEIEILLVPKSTRDQPWIRYAEDSKQAHGWGGDVVHWEGKNVDEIMDPDQYWKLERRLPGSSPRSFVDWEDVTRWAVPFRALQNRFGRFGPGWSSLVDIHVTNYARFGSACQDLETGHLLVDVEARHRRDQVAVVIRDLSTRQEVKRLAHADFVRSDKTDHFRASLILSPPTPVFCDLILDGSLIDRKQAILNSPSVAAPGAVTDESEGIHACHKVERLEILFVGASPRGTDALRIDREVRTIREAIELSQHREERVRVECRLAATVHDLRRALLNRRYDLVHVSSHGEVEGLILEDESGEPTRISAKALAGLFALHCAPRGRLRCVVLSACWSARTCISTMRVPVTISIEGQISDEAAIEFSRGFYDGLAAGLDFRQAYAQARVAVELVVPNETSRLVIIPSDEERTEGLASGAPPEIDALAPICPICGAEEMFVSEPDVCLNCGKSRDSYSAAAFGRTQLHIKFNPLEYSPRDAAKLLEAVHGEDSLLGLTGFVEYGEIRFRTRTLICRPQMTAKEICRSNEPVVGINVKWLYEDEPPIAECKIDWFSGEAHFTAVADDVGLYSEFFGAIAAYLPRDSFMAWGNKTPAE